MNRLLLHPHRRRGRFATIRADSLTKQGVRSIGGEDLGWFNTVGVNRDVRAIQGVTYENAYPGQLRMSTYQGVGVTATVSPRNVGEHSSSVVLQGGTTSALLLNGDYIRVDAGVVEGGVGFTLPGSAAVAGDTWTVVQSLQPSLIDTPSAIALTNVVSSNVSAANVTAISNNKFNLDIVVAANATPTSYAAHYATTSNPGGGGGGGGGGTGPTFGIDRMANQLHNPAWYPDFFICRRSMGLSHDSDAYAAAVLAEATGAGKQCLFYHYGLVGGAAEADVFTAAVGRTVGAGNEKHYGMAFDWEEGATSQAAVQAFMNRVRANTGGLCGLYTFWYFRPGGFPYGIGQDWDWVSYVVHPNHVPPGPYDIWQYNVNYTFEPPYGVDQDRSEMSRADLIARTTV